MIFENFYKFLFIKMQKSFSFMFVLFIIFIMILNKSESYQFDIFHIFHSLKPKVKKFWTNLEFFMDSMQKEVPKFEKVWNDTIQSIESNQLFNNDFTLKSESNS